MDPLAASHRHPTAKEPNIPDAAQPAAPSVAQPSAPRPPISVIVLTRNEEADLGGCLSSVPWCDDIHVLDSFSTDATLDIARAHGAHVWQRAFDNFAAQQNWGLEHIPFQHPWVFHMDADERCTPELAAAMARAVGSPGPNVAYRIQRRDFFLDTWLKHVQMMPFYDRLFRPEKMSYERVVHQISKIDGPVGIVTGYLDHYPFSKGIADWVRRHNHYSTLEAQQLQHNRRAAAPFTLRGALFDKDLHERRRQQKEFYYKLPLRPVVKFLLMYIGKRGFLDGYAGFPYSMLIAFYEYMIILKTAELQTSEATAKPSPLIKQRQETR